MTQGRLVPDQLCRHCHQPIAQSAVEPDYWWHVLPSGNLTHACEFVATPEVPVELITRSAGEGDERPHFAGEGDVLLHFSREVGDSDAPASLSPAVNDEEAPEDWLDGTIEKELR